MTDEITMFCRAVVGLTFAASALGKAMDLAAFRHAVADFGLLPERFTSVVAPAFLIAEVVVAGGVAAGGPGVLVGFGLGALLLAVFSTALVISLRRRARVVCNCFGRSTRAISPYDVVRNALLLVACGTGLAAYGTVGVHAVPDRTALLALGPLAVAFVVVVTNLEDLVETVRKPLGS